LNLNVNGHRPSAPIPQPLALFSIVTVVDQQQKQHPFELPKQLGIGLPTFADALALVRQQLWQCRLSDVEYVDTVKVPRANTWSDLLCYAA